MSITAYTYKNAPQPDRIKALYLSAFPKEERLPWWLLKLLAGHRGAEVTAYYDSDTFCGFTFSAACKNTLFVMFLAVDAPVRGKGYGSAILDYLKQTAPQEEILLTVELLDPAADNYTQRVRRMRFYDKNGFYDTRYNVDEVGGEFRVLANTPEPDMQGFLQVYRHMSFGFWNPPLEKIQ